MAGSGVIPELPSNNRRQVSPYMGGGGGKICLFRTEGICDSLGCEMVGRILWLNERKDDKEGGGGCVEVLKVGMRANRCGKCVKEERKEEKSRRKLILRYV